MKCLIFGSNSPKYVFGGRGLSCPDFCLQALPAGRQTPKSGPISGLQEVEFYKPLGPVTLGKVQGGQPRNDICCGSSTGFASTQPMGLGRAQKQASGPKASTEGVFAHRRAKLNEIQSQAVLSPGRAESQQRQHCFILRMETLSVRVPPAEPQPPSQPGNSPHWHN